MLGALHGLTKTGEGFGRPDGESSLPIDINYAKLVEWLVSRAADADQTNIYRAASAFGASLLVSLQSSAITVG
jgi:CDK5 regulatory subunit-associated protein 3